MKKLKINVDDSLINSDWIKSASWDLPLEPKAFLIAIGGNWENFQHLPAFRSMPESLKIAVNSYLQFDLSKHLTGQHDQSSHGNWAKNGGVVHKPNNLTGVAIPWKDGTDWSDVVPTGAPDDKQIEFASGLCLDSAPLQAVGQGRIFTNRKDIATYVDEVFAKYGYGDRVYQLWPDEDGHYLVDGIEAGVTRGNVADENHPLHNATLPVLIYKPKGVSQFVLLHEISHILEGNWVEGNAGDGGHNLPFLETWKYLLRNEGLDKQANVLDLFSYKTDGNGVFS